MTLDLAQFHQSFFEESFEALDAMEAALLKLEVGVPDPERINTIFRGAHSMKGGAAMLGFEGVTSFTHTLETLLDELRSGRMQVTAPITDTLLKSVDVLREMLRAVESKQPVNNQRVADVQFDLEMIVAQKNAAPAPANSPSGAQPAQLVSGAPGNSSAGVQSPVLMSGASGTSSAGMQSPVLMSGAPDNSSAGMQSPVAMSAVPGNSPASGQVAVPKSEAPATSHATTAAPAGDSPSETSGSTATDTMPGAVTSAGWTITFKPLPHLLLQGNDPLAIFAALQELGPVEPTVDLSALPPFAQLDPQICYISWQLRLSGDCVRAQIDEAFDWTTGDCELTIEPGAGAHSTNTAGAPVASPSWAAPLASPLSAASQVTDVHTVAASSAAVTVLVPVNSASPAATTSTHAEPTSTAKPSLVAGSDHAKPSSAESGSIRVGIDKIDELINTVGELVITQAMLSEVGRGLEGKSAELLRTGLAQLERNMRQLQESVMRVRMLPISVAFSRFPRMVHDLAQKLGKKIELKVAGEQTELDKTVLEKIGDPLVHLVRNCIDHGIETPDTREANGKPPFGTVSLNAYHSGGNIVIEVSDDGAGLNKERILEKARARGLAAPNDVLSDEQTFELIFLPGFSTAEKTTDVSGRGVGMDVVRQRVKELGGSVEIRSQQGRGSRFLITLPLTLAIVDGQSVLVGGECYIVPLTSIIESLQLKPQSVSRLSGHGEVFSFRGDYLPLVRLHELFGIEPRSRQLQDGLIVVAEGDGRRIGLFVDELLGQQQVVIKSMETNYGRIEGVSGATILGDGSVALIVDVPGLIRAAARRVAA